MFPTGWKKLKIILLSSYPLPTMDSAYFYLGSIDVIHFLVVMRRKEADMSVKIRHADSVANLIHSILHQDRYQRYIVIDMLITQDVKTIADLFEILFRSRAPEKLSHHYLQHAFYGLAKHKRGVLMGATPEWLTLALTGNDMDYYVRMFAVRAQPINLTLRTYTQFKSLPRQRRE